MGLAVGALGVVYGDIGTNSLFAMREAFTAKHHVDISEANLLGLLSLMFWSLLIIISLKYIGLVTRADNDGEGGILALSALATGKGDNPSGRRWVFVLLGLFGAALLYGDGVITPAISVLAAVEGTTIAAPSFSSFVVPVAIVILIALFAVQRKGTGAIGGVFGPVMIVWFVVTGIFGATQVAREPTVLRAMWPGYAVHFFTSNGLTAFFVLGAVILVVVGGEALYADLGHFGRRPILLGWYGVVLPSLLLVYFGQGALLLRDPSAIENPFYRMAPHWALYPLVALATVATVIASQALISGAYSLTHQAVQLGYSPRVRITHTSETHIGQIYIGAVNWFLMAACIGLVIGFRHSANLAAAYGVAVTTTMVLTTILFYVVAREHFGWRASWLAPLCAMLFVVDVAFFSATLFKIPEGGWFPLLMATVIFTVLSTWRTGQRIVTDRLLHGGYPVDKFVDGLRAHPPTRAPGQGVYLFQMVGVTPPALIGNLRYNDALHETVVVVSVVTEKRPRVPPARRAEITHLGDGFHQVVLHYGFMQQPDIPKALADHCTTHIPLDLSSVNYFVGRAVVRVTPREGMARWREHLYAFMTRNSSSIALYFRLPIAQTLELGVSVEL
jgi:KUP system potassium uptake protein